MGSRKYVSDYRLDKQLTPSGKVKTTAVYRGDWFTYCESPETIRKVAWLTIIAGAVAAVLLLPLLFNNTRIGRTIYVLLPMAFVLIPVYRLINVGIRLLNFKTPMTREQSDQTDKGLRRSCMLMVIMQGIYFAGCGVYCFTPGLQPGEWPIAVCVVAGMAISILLLTQRKKAKTEKVTEKQADPQ